MIDPLVATVARVTIKKDGKQVGMASGFFYENNSKLYFITNRHVVIDEADSFFPDEISLRLHTDPNDLQKNQELSIPLYHDEKPSWKEHQMHGKNVDIVAILLDMANIENRFFIRTLSPAIHVPQDIVIPLGQDVSVMGFPKGFHDELYNLPILRDATLASVYPVPFQGNPFILIDSHLHSGTSGSPVITKQMNMIQTTSGQMQIRAGNTRYLVGIHSASIDLKGIEDDDPLGLNCVWFASLIDEMTK